MAAKSKSVQKSNGIKPIEGSTDILIIAPHGVRGKGIRKDTNTDILARMIAEDLKCSALINDSIKRSECNYNSIADATKDKKFMAKIRQVLNAKGFTLVVWIHGILEKNRLKEKLKMGIPGELDCLIGFGQPDRDTATTETLTTLKKLLGDQKFYAHDALDGSRYCGWDRYNMNQWFKSQKKYSDFKKVQSIQIEFSIHRRKKNSVESTAKFLSAALKTLVRTDKEAKSKTADETIQSQEANTVAEAVSAIQEKLPVEGKDTEAEVPAIINETVADDVLVGKAYKFLKDIFVPHFQNAMLDAGRYLIQEFYGDSYDNARNGKRVKKESLNKLNERLQKEGHAPKKTWIYDAVKLAVDDHNFKDFSVYGKLGHSHKVLLLRAPKDEIKRQLAEETVRQNYTAAKLRERINEIKNGNKLRIDHILTRKELAPLEMEELEKLEKDAACGISRSQEQLKLNEESLKQIKQVIAEKAEDDGSKSKKGGFRDWTEPSNNVNICTGCENDCIYCYAHSMARRFNQLNGNPWRYMKIRQHDVDKYRKLHNGLVGFPSSHDITPYNIDAYLTVLGKLLRAGNEVLIVSKPRLDCIKRICDASHFFKDKILFRFTIGAMDYKILSFWEPNAPKYQERVKSLAYAYEHGFRTSVSMEPMLDTPNIEAMIKDLDPLVSEDIWLGTMNHLSQIKNEADDRLKQEIEIIENSQKGEMLAAIYNTYKDNSKIKWKTDAWKIIESYLISGRFSGWEKVRIQTEDDTEVEATAPLIISTSRRTDIPGFYSDLFIKSLRKRYLEKSNPYFQIEETISFTKTRLIVFWTKNPEPMFKYLDEIDDMEIGYYFQYTLNDYEKDLEPNVPSLKKRIDYFKALSKKIGKEKVIWRFDPLILTDQISKEKLVEKVHGIMSQLKGHTEKLVISFCDYYKKTVRKLEHAGVKYRDFSEDDKNYVAKYLGEMGKKFGIEVAACAEENFPLSYDIGRNKCIDDALIQKVFSKDDVLMEFIGDGTGLKDKGQRKLCGCIVSEDIGSYDTCLHNCTYCYACGSEKTVKNNVDRISKKCKMLSRDLPN